MEMLSFLFTIGFITSLSFVIWMKYTKSGRRWVEGDY